MIFTEISRARPKHRLVARDKYPLLVSKTRVLQRHTFWKVLFSDTQTYARTATAHVCAVLKRAVSSSEKSSELFWKEQWALLKRAVSSSEKSSELFWKEQWALLERAVSSSFRRAHAVTFYMVTNTHELMQSLFTVTNTHLPEIVRRWHMRYTCYAPLAMLHTWLSWCVCVCVCVCVSVCVWMCIQMYIYIYVYIYISAAGSSIVQY